MEISSEDFEKLKALEESLWIAEYRFDREKMNQILAEDFFEYGQSSRIYQRTDTLNVPAQEIHAVIPLTDFKIRLIESHVAQVTYISIVDYADGEARALRSSLWSRTQEGWKLRFHQRTPLQQG